MTPTEFAQALYNAYSPLTPACPSVQTMLLLMDAKEDVVIPFHLGTRYQMEVRFRLRKVKGSDTGSAASYEWSIHADRSEGNFRLDQFTFPRFGNMLDDMRAAFQVVLPDIQDQLVVLDDLTPEGLLAAARQALLARNEAQVAYDADPTQENADALSAAEANYNSAVARLLGV